MKIGIVSTWFERGAAYVSNQYRDVLIENNEVFIYVRGGESYAKESSDWAVENITYGKRYYFSRLDKIDLSHFKKWVIENRIELVFFNEQHLWQPVLLCNELKIKTGAYIDYYTKDTVDFFNIYDFLICNTQRHYSVFKSHKQAYYIPWGTDIKLFANQKRSIKKNVVIKFFHSAGMSPVRKGTDFIIQAMSKLKDYNYKMVIHTQVDLEYKLPSLKNEINELLDTEKLEIINKSVTAPGLYHLCDVYVYPTRLEGIGLTIVEAMASRLPVITTDEPPMNEFVNDSIGSLVKVKEYKNRKDGYYWQQALVDVSDLADKMKWYIDNFEKLDKINRNLQNYVKNNFNWYFNAAALSDIFNNVKKLEFMNKLNIINSINNFENQRSRWSKLSNSLAYMNSKRFLLNLLSLSGLNIKIGSR